ncbi:flotillin domain-containing protein [Ilyonectria robusta]
MFDHKAAPDDFLATSRDINGINVKLFQLKPIQRSIYCITQPCDFSMNLQAMTKKKLQLYLPVVLTVGPDVHHRSGADARPNDIPGDNEEDRKVRLLLMKYATLHRARAHARALANKKSSSQLLENTIKGIIERETRVLVSGMTVEKSLTERELSKKRLYCSIERVLTEGTLSKLGNAVNAILVQAPKEGLRTKRCTSLKSERRGREEQLEYDRKYLDLGYFPNPNLTDVDGHVRSRGGSVDDVVKAILDEDGWHHHDGRRPPTRSAHGHG